MDILELLLSEERREFTGWNFEYIEGRMKEFPLTWNYEIEIQKYIQTSDSLLDMGTGGGEFLSELTNRPKKTWATEGYRPNVEVAKNRLEPLGIKVAEVTDDSELPFTDNSFSLIINRHESYDMKEIKRILKPGGIFITQQAGGMNDLDLNLMLGASLPPYLDWNLAKALSQFDKVHFSILKEDECLTKTRFFDIGALVYYLKCIPWQVEDFSVEKYYARLLAIHRRIEAKGYIDFVCHRFILILKKL